MQPQQPHNQPVPKSPWSASEQLVPPVQKPRKKWRLLALFTAITLLLAGTAIALTFSAPACLTAQDYKDLTGQPYDGSMQAVDTFYTEPVAFKVRSSDYTDPDQLVKLARFYQQHSRASLHFTIDGTYGYEDQAALAEQRIAAAQKTLANAGVPQELIVVEPPVLIDSSDAAETADTEATTISITSLPGCRQG